MRDLQAVINGTHDAAAVAVNGLCDVVDILTVLYLAIDSQLTEDEIFGQISTVLHKALDVAREAKEAASRTSLALGKGAAVLMRPARFLLTVAAGLWWAPSIMVTVGRLLLKLAWWRLRLLWVQLLRVTGHPEAAMRALQRLDADTTGRR